MTKLEFDYKKLYWHLNNHHQRYKNYINTMKKKLTCQDCRGEGGYKEVILDDGSGPWFECGWCEGTGLVTPWLRGQWLKYKRMEKT